MSRVQPLSRLALLLSLVLCLLPALLPRASCQSAPPPPPPSGVGAYDVLWTAPSQLETESMPLGNGDLTLSVWVEAATGDLLYYAQDSAGYEENGQLLKLIRGRLHLTLPGAEHSAPPAPPTLDRFQHSLSLDTATQLISYSVAGVDVSVEIWVDRFHPVAHFTLRTSADVGVASSIEQWRTVPTAIGGNWQSGYYCTPQYVWPDELYGGTGWGARNGELLWWHRNDHDANHTYYDTALEHQNLTHAGLEPYNPLVNRTFGGYIRHTEGKWSDAVVAQTSYGRNATLTALAPLRHVSFDLVAFTTISQSEADYTTRFQALVDALPSADSSRAAHNEWWHHFWNRSHTIVHIPAQAELSYNLTQRLVLQRALDAMDGLSAYPIHFNGQGWNIGSYGDGAQGPDLRQWGSAFWWQNVREMYYPAVQAGDFDILHAMFGFYQRVLPVQELRTLAYYNHTGAYFDETVTMYGLVSDAGFGYTCDGTPHIHNNRWIRYHWDGALELCVLMIETYQYTLNDTFARATLLPVCSPILEFFRLHYPARDAHNRTVFYPSQALETWQCPNPDNSSQCVTNSVIFIGGLQYVLSELLALPASLVDDELRGVWGAQYAALPPLPLGACRTNASATCLQPADSWVHSNQNSENVELYMVWPYALYGLGINDSDIGVALNNYYDRPFPCNDGWCQDVVDAALLGLTDQAAAQILDRAAYVPADGWKFPVFLGPLQDSTPAADHYSVLRTAVQAVMIQEVPRKRFSVEAIQQQRGKAWRYADEAGFFARQKQAPADGTAILLFPTLPTGWDVDLKLLASGGTTVWATCRNGTLDRLVVQPPERMSDLLILGCLGRNSSGSQTERAQDSIKGQAIVQVATE